MYSDYDIHGNYACFYGGKFSQWCKCKFEDPDDHIVFNCAEQAMMYRKAELFNDTQAMTKILSSESPKEQKTLGRLVKKFDNSIWNKHKSKIVYKNNLLKFSQNDFLKEVLLSTGNLLLVECSFYDRVWGIGRGLDWPHLDDRSTWRGLNLLGYTLTEVRNEIRSREK